MDTGIRQAKPDIGKRGRICWMYNAKKARTTPFHMLQFPPFYYYFMLSPYER